MLQSVNPLCPEGSEHNDTTFPKLGKVHPLCPVALGGISAETGGGPGGRST